MGVRQNIMQYIVTGLPSVYTVSLCIIMKSIGIIIICIISINYSDRVSTALPLLALLVLILLCRHQL